MQVSAEGAAVEEQLRFAGKFQQLSAPVTAKGVEDTSFYIYNRLISLNEVGGEPDHFGIAPDAVHAYLRDRQQKWPYALSPLSTHDTKRGEDVRARLNVLSELPEEWRRHVERWGEMNAPLTKRDGGAAAPDRNDEYLIYQTLLGAWPMEPYGAEEYAEFVERVQAYLQKAMREAKVHTSWTDPNAAYEDGVKTFVAAIMDERAAGRSWTIFASSSGASATSALLNSLAQTVLRLAAPGVPDTYQGTELWNLSLVDPDNRRPVDYGHCHQILRDLRARVEKSGGDTRALAGELLRSKEDGRVKLFVTWRACSAGRGGRDCSLGGSMSPFGRKVLPPTTSSRSSAARIARRHWSSCRAASRTFRWTRTTCRSGRRRGETPFYGCRTSDQFFNEKPLHRRGADGRRRSRWRRLPLTRRGVCHIPRRNIGFRRRHSLGDPLFSFGQHRAPAQR